ncbi:MAG: ParB/RepB/Spo0J family partition protein [Candidatus Scalindua sp.]|nr:ParB/RepB/Spo0J family partition protein [Candidatus Scalindua sp.]
MDIKQISIKDIDNSLVGNMRYLRCSVRFLDAVMDSIGKVGLINPVIVQKTENRNKLYSTVCGYQRVRAFKELGIERIDARIVDRVTDEELLFISFYDNVFSRGFNDIEKAVILRNFLEIGYAKDRLLSEIIPLLGIPQNKNILDKYLSLFKLGGEIVDSLAKQEFEIEKAFLLIPLAKEERDSVYKVLFKESKTNINEAKETVRNLLDLKKIKQCGIPELLEGREIRGILQGKNTNKRQKGESIYRFIKSLRYPSIHQKEEGFALSIKELALNSNVRINHSRFFEKDEVQITLKVTDEQNLESDLNKLLTHVRAGSFKKIFQKRVRRVN